MWQTYFFESTGLDQSDLAENCHDAQKKADAFARGWEAAKDGDGTPEDRALESYRRMVRHCASLGRINRRLYVAGFVAACLHTA